MEEEENLGFGEGLEESTEQLFEDSRKRYLSDEETEPTTGMMIIYLIIDCKY